MAPRTLLLWLLAAVAGTDLDSLTIAFETSTSVEASGFTSAELTEFWLSSRHPEKLDFVKLVGSMDSVNITAVELVRRSVRNPTTGNEHSEPPTLSRNYSFHESVTLDLRSASAVVVGFERFVPHALDQLQVLSVREKPVVRSAGGTRTDETVFLEGEYGTWRLPGTFLRTVLPNITGAGHGKVTVYFFHGKADVTAGADRYTLESQTTTESPANNGVIRITRTTWYEISALASNISVDSHASHDVPTFSRGLSALQTEFLAADHPENLTGRLPRSGTTDQKSLWLTGNFQLQAFAQESTTDPVPRYRVEVSGVVTQVARGGATPTTLLALASATSVGVFAVLITGLVLLREVVVLSLSRLTFPLYTKLRKDRLLDVPARDSIYRLIKNAPGIHFLQLYRDLKAQLDRGVAFGALAYHLSQMERFQLIVSKREGRFRRYYDVGASFGADAGRIALLQTSPVPMVARAVLDHPDLTQSQLQHALSPSLRLTRQALAYHLKRLLAKELIAKETSGRFARYRATDRLRRLESYASGPPADASGAASGHVVAAGT